MLRLKDGKGVAGLTLALGGVVAVLCFASGPAIGQEMFLEASATQIDPGDSVTIFVFLADVAPTDLRAYQVTMPEFAAGGATGSLEYDGALPTIDIFHQNDDVEFDYIFFGLTAPAATDAGPPPRLGASIFNPADCVQVTVPKYLGEFVYIASGDANGAFVIDLHNIPEGTFLRDCEDPAAPISFENAGVTIMVGDVVDNDVVDCVPPNNSIDARQPSNPDGSDPAGLDSIEMIFQNDAVGVGVDDFAISQDPPGETPTIESVSVDGNTATVQLSGSVSTVAWTMLTYVPTGTTHCFGWLPGDVNSSLVANASDVLSLIDHLNGAIDPLPDISTDIDRSGLANASDVLRTIDLLNGGGVYDVFNGASLPPSPCGD